MGSVWVAPDAAVAPSDSTLSAADRFTGMATLAFISDMAARSGSASPASSSSSARVTLRKSSAITALLDALDDRGVLGGTGVGSRVVREDVGRDGGVDRSR